MPNKKAAIKSLRKDKKKHAKNKAVKSELRTLTKKARLLITDGKKNEAETLLRTLESKLDRAAKSHIIKKENAARKVSRLRTHFASASKSAS
ncbi:MAG: 30S ribosomal protein S20 [Candidatus Omnitrophica bacterium]|nr:30S ribosomal protein S20 [Candidatus Omnitrophota bacterium]MDD5488445.1 30S ribosomal protein S20 [Candidatus Omnitrophota bacterium]